MSDTLIVGVVAVLAGIVGGRVLMERALARLPAEGKGRLVEAFQPLRLWQLLPLVALLVGMVAADRAAVADRTVLVWAFLGAMAAYVVVMQVWTQRILGRLDLPEAFRRAHLAGRIVQSAGLGAFVVALIVDARML
jgi:hypothetical protein